MTALKLAQNTVSILVNTAWVILISPVVIPAAVITYLVAGRDGIDISEGITAGMTFAAACFGITMLYVGLAIGHFAV